MLLPAGDKTNDLSASGKITEQRHPPGHAEPGYFGANSAQTALAARARKIHVDPWQLVSEPLQQPHGENVIGATFHRALLDIGNAALERLVVVVVERKDGDPLPTGLRGSHGGMRQFFTRGEDAPVAGAPPGGPAPRACAA